MTKAIFEIKNGQPCGFHLSGHAEYAEYGQDIVCSSITTSVFTTLNLLEKLLNKEDYQLNISEDSSLIDFSLKTSNDLSSLIINNLLEILTNIEEQYPHNLKITKK